MSERTPDGTRDSEEPYLRRARASRLDRLRIRHLRFLEFVETGGSLSAAAERLSLSQPAATKMLHELEAIFGAELVARTTRGAVLTSTGRLALDRLRIALNALDAAMQAIDAVPPLPVVRLGILPLVGVVALPKLLARMAAQPGCPRLVVHESTVAGLLAMLSTGELDCVVGRVGTALDPPATSEMLVTPLWGERLAIACALDHPVGRKRMVGVADLRDYEWVTTPHGAHTRTVFEAPFLDAGIVPPQPKVESFSFHTNLCIVANSRMLTVAPESAVRHYARLGMVREVRHGIDFPSGRTVFITRDDTATSPGVVAVKEALAGLMAEAGFEGSGSGPVEP